MFIGVSQRCTVVNHFGFANVVVFSNWGFLYEFTFTSLYSVTYIVFYELSCQLPKIGDTVFRTAVITEQ